MQLPLRCSQIYKLNVHLPQLIRKKPFYSHFSHSWIKNVLFQSLVSGSPKQQQNKTKQKCVCDFTQCFFWKPLDSTRVIIVQLRFMYVLKKFYYKYVLLFLKNDNVSTIASCVEE